MEFIQARNYTRVGSPPRRIDVIVLHTMENPEKPDGAENVARWFAGPTAPRASAHYCVDSDSVVQSVRDEDVAWHAPGANHNGIGVEHAGRARQTPREWNDPYSRAMLERSARLVADLCRRHQIPVRLRSSADLKAGRRGITTHAAVSLAFKRSTHWDPGTGFPFARYMALIEAYTKPPPPRKPPAAAVERVDVDVPGRPERLRGQSLENPAVRARVARWAKRFGRVVIRRREPS